MSGVRQLAHCEEFMARGKLQVVNVLPLTSWGCRSCDLCQENVLTGHQKL